MARLHVRPPVDSPWSVELTGDVVVGRREPADVVIRDALVSRRHCRIAADDGGWTIEDLGSANGTFLDGRRITRAALSDGARIELGFWALTFER